MKFIIHYSLFLILSFSLSFGESWSGKCFSQSWQPLDKGFNNTVRVLFADTIENAIYAGGEFDVGYPGIQNYPQFLAKWNDSLVIWDTVKKIEVYPGSYISAIGRFNDKLFVGGNHGFLYWFDGVNWDSISVKAGSANFPYNFGSIYGFYNYNNQVLYTLGMFDSIGNLPFRNIAKYDGTNWYGLQSFILDEGWSINTAMMYKGKLYVGGNFSTPIPEIKDIARFNFSTNQWESVGGGATCDCWINKLYIYRDTLIVAGYFQSLGGQSHNNIAAWDGDNWIALGNGVMPSNVHDVVEYDNNLYAAGQIGYLPDGTPIKGIAKWDGQQWSDAGFNFGEGFNQGTPTALATLDENLYIGGSFVTFNGDTVNSIVKYTAPLSIEENTKTAAINIYPNPGSGKFTLQIMNDELRMKNFEVKIYNILGEKILQPRSTQIGVASASLQPHSTFSIDISNQPQGIYFYQIKSGEKTYSGKMVKE